MFSSHLPLLKVYILLYVLSKHAIFHIIITQTVPAAVPVSTVDSEQHAIRLTSYTQSHTQGLLELVFVSCVLNCVFSSHLPESAQSKLFYLLSKHAIFHIKTQTPVPAMSLCGCWLCSHVSNTVASYTVILSLTFEVVVLKLKKKLFEQKKNEE